MNVVYSWREAPAAEFAVIGDPVSHSRSPVMHSAAYAALGLHFRYLAIHVLPGEVSAALDRLTALGFRGVNVTVPHKEEVLAWAQIVEPLAARIRAANTVRLSDRACINTDAPGFLDTLADFQLTGRTVLLLGAGGAARATAVALIDSGFDLRLYNRTQSKAEALAKELGLPRENVMREADPAGASLIVNTTSASLANEDLPILWDHAEADALAYDLMYSEGGTRFVRTAIAHGLATADGLRLLAAQGARSFEWWIGVPAPRDVMLDAIQ